MRYLWYPLVKSASPSDLGDQVGKRKNVKFPSEIIGVSSYRSKGGVSVLTFVLTFSNDGGLTTEKQTRKTSVWGYESGLNRLSFLALLLGKG